MSEQPLEPKIEGNTIHLFGVGPDCPKCGGPTHSVTGDETAEQPWWCQNCNLRVASDGSARGYKEDKND